MTITRSRAIAALNLISALPLSTLAPAKLLTALMLLKVDLRRIVAETEAARQSLLDDAKQGVEGFDDGLSDYLADPDAHPDFKAILAQVDERFAPAWREVLSEEVELRRSLLTSYGMTDLIATLPAEPMTIDGREVQPIDVCEMIADLLVASDL